MAKKKLTLTEQVEQDNLAKKSPFNQEGAKSFVKDAMGKMGLDPSEEKANKIIQDYNYDYDKIIDYAGNKTGIKDMDKFREAVYTKYNFSKPSDTELAEMQFVKVPVTADPEGGYEKYTALEDELSVTNAFIQNIQAEQPVPETEEAPELSEREKLLESQLESVQADVTKVAIPEKQLRPTDPRVLDLQSKAKQIEAALREQSDFNIKSLGSATEQHEAVKKEYETYDSLLGDAVKTRYEQASKLYTPYGTGVTYREEDDERVKDLRNLKEIYRDMGKLMGAPKGEGWEKQAKALMYGFGNNFFTKDFATLGINEMSRLFNVKSAFDTKQKLLDEGKTEEEISQSMPSEELALLDSYQMLLEIQAGADPNQLYYWGEGLKDMIPFIVQFAATSGVGAGAKKAVTEYVKAKTKSGVAGKIAGSLTKSMMQAGAMVPANVLGYAERVAPTTNEKGELVEGMNPLKAAVIAYVNTVAEVVGEDVGTYLNKTANKAAKVSYRRMIGSNPNKAQKFLGKMALALTADTNIPMIQGVVFEGLGEEVTGLLQAVINQDDSFFTSDVQKQIWGMSLIASGSFMSTSVPGRLRARSNYNQSKKLIDDIPNAEYATSVEQLSQNYDNVEDLADALGQVNEQFGNDITPEDKAKARIFISNAIVYNQMNTTRAIKVEEQIAQSVGQDGNVTLVQHEGQPHSVRNPQDLGQDGKVIFLKDKEGTVKPVISSKLTDWDSKTNEEIVDEAMKAEDEQDVAFEAEQQAQEETLNSASERGLVEGKTVITPQGKQTLISVNLDGTSTVENTKGEQLTVNTDEIEAYKTTEQKTTEKETEKETEKAEQEGEKVVSDEPLFEGSDTRVIDYANGTSTIITPEGEQTFETTEDRDAAIEALASAELEAVEATEGTIDDLPPEQRFSQLREQNENIANQMLTDDIAETRSQAEELRKLETVSKQERFDNLDKSEQLEAEAQRLEEILKDPSLLKVEEKVAPEEVIEEPVQIERTPDLIHAEFQQEQENAPYNQLLPWQQELLNRKVNRDSFTRFGDRNMITQGLSRSWFAPKEQATNSANIDIIAQELSEMGVEVTPDDIVNFITENPTASVRKTTDAMNELQGEYKELTDQPIHKHKTPTTVTEEQLAKVPFRAAPEVVGITDKAREDLISKTRIAPTLQKLQETFGIPVQIINSKEVPDYVKRSAKKKGILPAGYYDDVTKQAYIISDIAKTVGIAEIKKTYMHEAVLHNGLEVLFNTGPVKILGKTFKNKNALLDEVYSRMDEDTITDRAKTYAKGISLDQLTDSQKRELAEEAMATLNETESPRLQVFMDKIYNFFRKLTGFGFTSKQFTKAEFRQLLRDHRDLIIKQKQDAEIIRENEGRIPETRDVKEAVDEKGREDIQQQEEAVAEAGEAERVKFKTDEGELISQEEMVQSENFKQWSNNAPFISSKESSGFDFKTGSPVVVEAYHGGYAPINKFDENYGGDTTADNEFGAFYFSNERDVADDYSRESIKRRFQDYPEGLIDEGLATEEEVEQHESEGDVYNWVEELASENLNIVEGFVRFDNPYVVDAKHQGLRELETEFNIQEMLGFITKKGEGMPDLLFEDIEWDEDTVEENKEEIEVRAREEYGLEEGDEVEDYMISEATDYVLEEAGYEKEFPEYDGLIITNVIDDIGEGSQDYQNLYIAIDPNQIKSQDNRGTFDRYNPDIRFRQTEIDNVIETSEGLFELNEDQVNQRNEMVAKYGKKRADELIIDFIDANDLKKYNKVLFRVAETQEELDDFVKDSKVKETVYHGTAEMFDEFDPDKTMDGMFWFTSNIDDIKSGVSGAVSSKVIMPVKLNINNPAGWEQYDKLMIQQIIEQGYDGIILDDYYVAFSPDQILIEPKEDVKFKVEEEREKVETNPSEEQKEAGNYKMGHITFDGFDVTIENPRGSIRSGENQEGEKWSNVMPADYGYFKGTIGKDKDHIDTFMGENLESDKVYVVDQVNEDGSFDEHKVMMGYNSLSEARNAYMEAYDVDWQGLGTITRTTKDGLKEWFKGNTKKPFAPESDVKFQVTSKDPKIQAMLNKLQAVQDLSKTAAKIKGLEEEQLQAIGPQRKFLQDKLELYKEAVEGGKAEAKELIKEVQTAITDYAKKALPLTVAGAREIGPILTLIKNTQTPEDVEAAFNRIDELAGVTTEKQQRRKYVAKVNRLLKWMTGLKKLGTKRVGKFNYEDTKAFLELKDVDNKLRELTKQLNANAFSAKEKQEAISSMTEEEFVSWETKKRDELVIKKQKANTKLDQEWDKLNDKPDKTSLDEAIMKLIELRRLGSKASPALAKAVAEELEAIYSQAKEAKTEADVEKAISRKADKEFMKNFVRGHNLKNKPIHKRAMAALNNFVSNSVGNWETLMTVLAGYKGRDEFSLIINQVNQEMGIQDSFDKALNSAQKAYGFKTKNQMLKHIQELNKEKYKLRQPNRKGEEGEGDPKDMSTFQLIDIYNAIKNKKWANDYFMAYGDITLAKDGSRDENKQREDGEKTINELLNNLEDADRVFADVMMEGTQAYKESTNDVFIKMFNRDMPFRESYWPSTAEFESDTDVMDVFFENGTMPSFTKETAAHRTPRPVSAFDKFNKHVKQSEWYKNMALPLDRINKVFKDKNVETLITQARGERFFRTIKSQFKKLGLGASTNDLTDVERIGGKILGNWVAAKIGFTPSVPLKQLTSMINYAENMPVGSWGTGFVKGLATPKATFDWMWENVPYLKTRFKGGYSEALQFAMGAASNVPKASNAQQAIKNIATSGTRFGDIAAIVYGGKPYIDYLMKKKGLSQEKAVEQFMLDTLRSQQSPFSSTLSTFQNSKNPFAKALFVFANTPSQYMRKMFEANQAYKHGDISAAQLGKIYAIYGVANQFLYVGAGALISAMMRGSDPEEDLLKNTVVQSLTSLVAGIPLVRDLVNTTLKRTTGLHVYDDALPVIGELDEISEAIIKSFQGKDPEKNFEKAFTLLLEMGGIPASNAKKLWNASFNREETVAKTVKYEVRDKLNELKDSKNKFEARIAKELKQSYSNAKSKATRLRNDGKTLQADRITQLIEDSKLRLRDNDYNKLGVELRMFNSRLDIID
jgi:hypothetical protein